MDCASDVGGEVQVCMRAAIRCVSRCGYDLLQAWFIDGKDGGLPGRDPRLAEIDDFDIDIGVLVRNDSARRPAL